MGTGAGPRGATAAPTIEDTPTPAPSNPSVGMTALLSTAPPADAGPPPSLSLAPSALGGAIPKMGGSQRQLGSFEIGQGQGQV